MHKAHVFLLPTICEPGWHLLTRPALQGQGGAHSPHHSSQAAPQERATRVLGVASAYYKALDTYVGLYSDLYFDVFCRIPIRSRNTSEYRAGYIHVQNTSGYSFIELPHPPIFHRPPPRTRMRSCLARVARLFQPAAGTQKSCGLTALTAKFDHKLHTLTPKSTHEYIRASTWTMCATHYKHAAVVAVALFDSEGYQCTRGSNLGRTH